MFCDGKSYNYYTILENSARLIKSYQPTVSLPISQPVELTYISFSLVPGSPNNGKEIRVFIYVFAVTVDRALNGDSSERERDRETEREREREERQIK